MAEEEAEVSERKEEKKVPAKKKAKEKEAEEVERIYVVPLKFVKRPGSRRTQLAVHRIKQFLSNHMKVEEEKVWIASSLNQAIWTKGKYKVPSKIRIRAIKFSDGEVEASLPGESTRSYREEMKEEKEEKKAPAKKKAPAPKKAKEEKKAPAKKKAEEAAKVSKKGKTTEKKVKK
jgi:large subunit ribosomal protein L31e